MDFLSRAEQRRHEHLLKNKQARSSPNDWCGHCGRPLEDGQCPVHADPDEPVSEEDAWRIKDEQRHNFDG